MNADSSDPDSPVPDIHLPVLTGYLHTNTIELGSDLYVRIYHSHTHPPVWLHRHTGYRICICNLVFSPTSGSRNDRSIFTRSPDGNFH